MVIEKFFENGLSLNHLASKKIFGSMNHSASKKPRGSCAELALQESVEKSGLTRRVVRFIEYPPTIIYNHRSGT